MKLPGTAMTYLVSMVAGGIAAFTALAPPRTQTNPASTFDPLSAFVGTWTATKSNESTSFLTLKLMESDGKLVGTMSHFKIGVVGTGRIVGTQVIKKSALSYRSSSRIRGPLAGLVLVQPEMEKNFFR